MKKILILLSAVCMLAACGALRQSPEEAARMQAQVQERLDSRRFKVDISYVLPTRGASRPVTSPYSLTVNGDKLISHLPYFGVAYNVPYGGGKVLNFESSISSYEELPSGRDRRTIVITTDNEEDILVYRLVVFDNGKCSLNVRSRNREPIDFQGNLDPDADPARKEKD